MEQKYIVLVIIIALFVLFIALFAILSWKYQQKHQPYIEARKKYFSDYSQLKRTYGTNFPISIIETNLNLPSGENFYLIKKNLTYFTQELKTNLSQTRMEKLLVHQFNTDYEIIEQKANYSLSNRVAKYYKTNFIADLFVTNKQILLKDQKQIIDIKFSDVIKIAPELITIKSTFLFGIIVYTKEQIYKIIDDDLINLLIIQTLFEKNKEEQKNG